MKTRIGVFFLIELLSLCSCVSHKTINTVFLYKVDSESSGMGKIVGDYKQNVLHGDYSLEVTATPNDGYTFVSWSDGNINPSRSDQAQDELLVTYYAYFEVANKDG